MATRYEPRIFCGLSITIAITDAIELSGLNVCLQTSEHPKMTLPEEVVSFMVGGFSLFIDEHAQARLMIIK